MVPTSTTADSLPKDICEEVIIDISLPESGPVPTWTAECCIYGVPQILRQENIGASTPKVISIGSFHHGKEELRDMEMLKLKYFKEFFQRTETMQRDIANVIANWQSEILHCYEGIILITREDFLKMVLLDSIFIIEHFSWATAEGENENNNMGRAVSNQWLKMTNNPWWKAHIVLDLILLENQIPFFILDELYKNFFSSNKNEHDSFFNLARKYFGKYLFSQEKQELPEKEVKHFTDLIRYMYYPSKPETEGKEPDSYVYSAAKLYERGVRFGRTEEGRLDKIKFKKWEPLGKCQCFSWLLIFLPCLKCFPCLEPMQSLLYLPSFVANNRTEVLFRNIMALEQCHYSSAAYLCNYMVLLDYLINTSEDVELLVDKGIIVNALGSYQEIVNMVNRIARKIEVEKYCYSGVAKNLRNHYKNGCNRNMGYLKSTYFSNLWRGTATVVGFIVLGFTLWDFVRSSTK